MLIYEVEEILCIDLRDCSGKIISEVMENAILACEEVENNGLEIEIKILKDHYE